MHHVNFQAYFKFAISKKSQDKSIPNSNEIFKVTSKFKTCYKFHIPLQILQSQNHMKKTLQILKPILNYPSSIFKIPSLSLCYYFQARFPCFMMHQNCSITCTNVVRKSAAPNSAYQSKPCFKIIHTVCCSKLCISVQKQVKNSAQIMPKSSCQTCPKTV